MLTSLVQTLVEKPVVTVLAVVAIIASYLASRAQLSSLIIALLWGAALLLVAMLILAYLSRLGLGRYVESQYTTRDIMVMAMLIAVGGVAKTFGGQARLLAEGLGGPYAAAIVAANFYMWGVVACHLVRKPLSGTISMTLGGIVEILLGNPFGLPVLLFNFWEGLGPDIAYGVFRYRRYNLGVAIFGGILAAVFGLFYGWYYFGFEQLPLITFIIYIAFVVLGGVVGGVVGYYIGVAAEKLGVKPPAPATIES